MLALVSGVLFTATLLWSAPVLSAQDQDGAEQHRSGISGEYTAVNRGGEKSDIRRGHAHEARKSDGYKTEPGTPSMRVRLAAGQINAQVIPFAAPMNGTTGKSGQGGV